jgi:GAF domain-containing protein
MERGGATDRRAERPTASGASGRFRPTHATTLSEDREDTLGHLLRLTTRALDVPLAYVALLDGPRFIVASHDGLSASAAAIGQFEAHGSWSGLAVARRDVVIVSDPAGTAGNPEAQLVGSVAHVAIPLEMRDGEIVGTLCAASREPRSWTARDAEMLEHAARAAALTLRNREVIHAGHSMSDLLRRTAATIQDLGAHVRSLVGLVATADDPRVRTFAALADARLQALDQLRREADVATRSAGERPPGGPHRVDVVELVRRSLASARAAAGSSDAFLDAPATPVTAQVDPLELEESLTNLLLALMHYASADGQIHVRLGVAEDRVRLDIVKLGAEVPIAQVTRLIGQFRFGRSQNAAAMRLVGDTFSAASGAVRARSSPGRTAFRITLPGDLQD